MPGEGEYIYRLAQTRRKLDREFLRAVKPIYKEIGEEAAAKLALGTTSIDILVPTRTGDRFVQTMLPYERRAMTTTFDVAADAFRISVPIPDFDAELDRAAQRLNRAPLTMKRRVRSVLRELDAGLLTREEAVVKIRREGLKDWRGRRLARTEIAMSTNDASAIAFEEGGADKVRLRDGPGCRLGPGHNRGEIANGLVVTFAKWRGHLVSHPNCVRFGTPILS